ncbi:MAG TPA: protein-methionine-sulfoxide reductase heme-binding subunit MsrQ [Luteitalea sp.]|nr:protein-methionine-sulfoxide reductase heme-binding subunit MsrQ [Luteitalea sp.]
MPDLSKAEGRPPKAVRVSFRSAKPLVWILCLAPLAWLVYRAVFGGLSPNPIDDITDETGQWALRLLLVSLAVTPVRRLTGWNGIIQWRRLLGLFAFFYVCLHLATYVVLDQFFDLASILADVAKRRYITVGVAGFLCLLPLAVTSTTGWIRRLGRKWQTLHRLAYVAAVCGVVHLLWIVKGDDLREPFTYGAILAVLMAVRVVYWTR